jgi:FAD/FMN-containing dehydrogenase
MKVESLFIHSQLANIIHSYLGKSTGKGSLALWTHNLKHSEILPYKSSYYNGTAAQIGAGVIAGELYALAASRNYRAVGGTCASIGVAGGYAAGGGHSLLNGLYGMAADNVLEWELVTANGEHIVATPTNEHSDLYWAMSGGGAGVWGVVLSMTTRIFVDGQVGGARLRFGAASADQTDQYWEAIEAWHVWLDSYVEGGNTVEYEVLATSFEAIGFTVPNQNADGVDKLLAPYLQVLDSLGLSYNYSSHTSPDYFHHFETDFGPLPYGRTPATTLLSNRLIPRSVVEDAESRTAFIQAIQNLTAYQDGYFFLGCEGVRVNSTNHPDNAVLPAWRDTLGVCSVTGFWDWTIPRAEMMARKEHLAYEVVPSFEKVTPGSGSYLNEADSFYTGNWTKEFYGANYARLSEVKAKYDPNHLFYAYTGVGSEFWESDANGRLCRVCTEG